MADYWPQNEGVVVDGFSVAFGEAYAAIEAFETVHMHTTATTDSIYVAPAAAAGDGYAIALKAATAQGDIIPVMYLGIIKMQAATTMNEDDYVSNAAGGTQVQVIATMTAGEMVAYRSFNYTGSAFRLGKTLNGAVTDDDILVLVGLTG